jgi:hypothetical protein
MMGENFENSPLLFQVHLKFIPKFSSQRTRVIHASKVFTVKFLNLIIGPIADFYSTSSSFIKIQPFSAGIPIIHKPLLTTPI